MIVFLTEPTMVRAPKGRIRLVTPLFVTVDDDTVIVPDGFVTDGASVPALFWPVVSHPLAPSSLRAAILHDFQYRTASVTRKDADDTFYRALRADGCAWLRAKAMWLAVRLFGWTGYGRR